MAHSLPSLYLGTFGRLGYVLIPLFLFRVCSRSPAFDAQLYSVTNARIQMMTVSSSVRDVGSSKKFKIDLEQLEARIKHLDSARASTAYQRQKSQLEAALSAFLASSQPRKSLFSATPRDIVRFLVWKDGKGKTMVHKDSCQFFGLQGKQSCNCPTRLSAGTVDSLIGKLRSIFNVLSRTSDWDDRFGSGNPASHLCIKQYLKSIQSEQSQARVSPKQATPVFFDKYKKLVYHLPGDL